MTTDWSIRDLRAADGGAQLLLTLENGAGEREMLMLFASRLRAIPQIGGVDAAQLEHLRREAAVTAAMRVGLRMLSVCGTSRRHLTEKLRARGHAADVAAEAVEDLATRGYLNEAEGALREAERGLAKLWGDRRILADLRAKGYGDGALERVRECLSYEDAIGRCVRLLRRLRAAIPTDAAQLHRLLARMQRYGYAPAEAKRALRRMWNEK